MTIKCPHCGYRYAFPISSKCRYCGKDMEDDPETEVMSASRESQKKCAACGRLIDREVLICPHCGDNRELKLQLARTEPLEENVPTSASHGGRGRVSELLYLGAGLIALGGLLSASAIASVHGGERPPSYSDYWAVIIIVGVAFVLVGFARQAERMRR